MTEEEQAKLVGKWAIEAAPRPLPYLKKEVLKRAVDNTANCGELLFVVALSRVI